MRPLALALVVVAALAALAPAASAGVSFEPSMEPRAFSWSPGRQLVYRLRMTTGARRERFDVTIEAPGWRAPLFSHQPLGQPMEPIQRGPALRLRGPGSLGAVSKSGSFPIGGVCQRGYGAGSLAARRITLPPSSISTLVARYRASFDSAPFRGTDMRVTFVAEGGTLAGEQRFKPPRATVRPPYGVRIALATRPRSRYAGGVRPVNVRRGRSIAIRGAAHGVRTGVVSLRHTTPGAGARLRTLARVRTDRRGRFRHRGWRPRRPGLYELVAVYGGAGRRLTKDRSCFRAFVVR